MSSKITPVAAGESAPALSEDLGNTIRLGNRRVGAAKTSYGDGYLGGIPSAGGALVVKPNKTSGFKFEVMTRVEVQLLALIDILEQENKFTAQLVIGLEWEVSQEQWALCEDFWTQEYIPKMRLFFKDTEERTNILEAAVIGNDEVGTEIVDTKSGKTQRFFRLKRRVTQTFSETLHLQPFPFDNQYLSIHLESEPAIVQGRPYEMVLEHPIFKVDGSPGAHRICKDADKVDDCSLEAIFGLTGEDVAGSKEAPKRNEYVTLIFVSRNFASTVFNLILPTLVIELFSLMIFWVNPCLLADRASVTLTLLLTLISFKSYVADKLPAVPYLTTVEKYLMCCYPILIGQGFFQVYAAKFCAGDGFLGQIVFRRYRRDPWDPADDGGASPDFWSESERTRAQTQVDCVSFWFTIIMMLGGIVCYIVEPFCSVLIDTYKILKHKAEAEGDSENYPSLASLFDENIVIMGVHPLRKLRLVRTQGQHSFSSDEDGPRQLDEGQLERMDMARLAGVKWFRETLSKQAVGYTNEEVRAEFPHAYLLAKSVEQRVDACDAAAAEADSAPIYDATEQQKAIIIDAGTGETKMILCSFIDSESPAVKVVEHCPYKLPGEKKTPLIQVCTSGDTSHFEEWFETTVRPSFIITADDVEKVSEEMLEKLSEGETDVLEEALGLKISCGEGARSACFEVESVVDQSLAHTKEVRLDWDEETCPNWALDTSNGKPFSPKEFARQLCRLRAVGSSSFTSSSLKPADRVKAIAPVGYHANSAACASSEDIVWPGALGTVVANRTPEILQIEWDDFPELMHELVPAASVELVREVHVRFLIHAEIDKDKWIGPKIILGTGAWFRNSDISVRGPLLDVYKRLSTRVARCDLMCLTALDEANYEDKSVRYAHQCMSYLIPDASVAVGNGSTQFLCLEPPSVSELVHYTAQVQQDNAQVGTKLTALKVPEWRVLARRRVDVVPEHDGGGGRFTYEYDIERVGSDRGDDATKIKKLIEGVSISDVRTAPPHGATLPKAPHMLQMGNNLGKTFFCGTGAAKSIESCHKKWKDEAARRVKLLVSQNSIPFGVMKTVCCISACFYAATEADVPTNPSTVSVRDAKNKFQVRLKHILNLCKEIEDEGEFPTPAEILAEASKRDSPKDKKKRGPDHLLNISNITYQLAICEILGDEVEMRFCRDWLIDGVEFRTTWSTGWYLDYLVRSKTKLLATKYPRYKGFAGLV